MSSWPRMTLEEAGVTVHDCEHKTPPAADDGIPYIAIPQMKDGRIDTSDARLVAPEDVPVWNRRVTPRQGDVMLSRRCNPGETVVVPEGLECVLGQNLVILRANAGAVSQRYLRWATCSPEWWQEVEKNRNVGAVFDSLRCADIPGFTISVPPSDIQDRICDFLDALDGRIALNHAMNQTLEDIARSIFKSWFIDQDPVHAKAADEPTGLAPEIDALFPDAFQETEEGMVPEGWEVTTLSAQFDIRRGLSYTSAGLAEPRAGVPMHNLNSVREGGGYKESGLKWYSGEFQPQHEVKVGDVVVASLEQTFDHTLVGHAARIPAVGGGTMIFTQDLFKVEPRQSSALTKAYAYYLLNSDRMHRLVSGFANGTTIERIPKDALEMPRLAVPPAGLVQAFSEMADIFHEKIMANKGQADTLENLRDFLLPGLVSGEVQIPVGVSA